MNQQEGIASIVRAITLAVAEMAFLALIISFVVQTIQAKAGSPPDLPDVQVSAAGALAVALGGGYAFMLGIPTKTPADSEASILNVVKTMFSEKLWLSLGVIFYMVAGIATCLAYGLNETETPGILKTIAVGFGGYVIAYIGAAYRQLNQP
jgi:hypothetical protein